MTLTAAQIAYAARLAQRDKAVYLGDQDDDGSVLIDSIVLSAPAWVRPDGTIDEEA